MSSECHSVPALLAGIIRLDMTLLHRQQRAFMSILIFPAAAFAFLYVADRVPMIPARHFFSPPVLSIVVSIFITEEFRWLYTGWGMDLRHAIVLGISPAMFTTAKNVTGLSIILLPNVTTVLLCAALSGLAVNQMSRALLFAVYLSIIVLFTWNWLHFRLHRICRQDLVVVMACIATFTAMSICFSAAYRINPFAALLATMLLCLDLAWHSARVWPRKIRQVQDQLLEGQS
jgi:hypothetical protein